MTLKYIHLTLLTFILILAAVACANVSQPQAKPSLFTFPIEAKPLVVTSQITQITQITPSLTASVIKATPKPTLTKVPSSPTAVKIPPQNAEAIQISLDKTKLGPPVQELIYAIHTPLNEQLVETSIWRATLNDIANPDLLLSISHQKETMGVNNPTLSPNGKYLIYGRGYNPNAHWMEVRVLNLDDKTELVVDNGGIIPSPNWPIFMWTPDSQSIIYAKTSKDWDFAELYQYTLETGETELLITESNYIGLMGQNGFLIYYIPMQIPAIPYHLKYIDLKTKQSQEIALITQANAVNYVRMSPDKTQISFTGLLVNLNTGVQRLLPPPFAQGLWFPDGQAIIGGSPPSILYINQTNQQSDDDNTIILKLPADISGEQLVAWSPNGRYLLYKNKLINNQVTYFILNLQSGERQQFPNTHIFQIGGWLTTQ